MQCVPASSTPTVWTTSPAASNGNSSSPRECRSDVPVAVKTSHGWLYTSVLTKDRGLPASSTPSMVAHCRAVDRTLSRVSKPSIEVDRKTDPATRVHEFFVYWFEWVRSPGRRRTSEQLTGL